MKTAIEKSHSKVSNFKLTMICILASISTSAFFLSLSLKNHIDSTIFIVSLIVTGTISLLSILLFNKFKR